MRRLTLSCTNVSFMPESFAPPQPKHLFAGFGANVILSLKLSQLLSFSLHLHFVTSLRYFTSLLHFVTPLLLCAVASNESYATSLGSPRPALAFAHLDA